ncbi:hypothetical protein Plhal703r1_c07g0040201 [Plasmopara halstedii]
MNLNLTCGNRPSAPTILFISIIHHLSHTACGLVESKRPLCKVHSNQPQFTWKHFLSIPRLALRGLHLSASILTHKCLLKEADSAGQLMRWPTRL